MSPPKEEHLCSRLLATLFVGSVASCATASNDTIGNHQDEQFSGPTAETKLLVLSCLSALGAILCRILGWEPWEIHPRLPTLPRKHMAWIVPTVLLLIFHVVWGGQNEHDLVCTADNWLPMIPFIAKLYLPWFGTGDEIRETLLANFQGTMLLNVFNKTSPQRLLPSIDEPHLTDSQVGERRHFFLPNYAALVLATLVFLEAAMLCSAYGVPLVKTSWHKIREAAESNCRQKPDDEMATPLLTAANPDPQPKDPPQPDIDQASDQKADIDQASDQKADIDLASDPTQPKIRTIMTRRQTVYAYGFHSYYVIYHMFLYVWIDVTVAGGMMNFQTGAAWEIWSLALVFELAVQVCVGTATYALSPGQVFANPTSLLLPAFSPWTGNIVHILKDHMSQGLCFTVARCSTGVLSSVGLFLGYASFAATFLPLVKLLRTQKCHEGLRAAHWQIAESPALQIQTTTSNEVTPQSTRASWSKQAKEKCMTTMITSCTREKEIRALWGEVPHTALHILFVIFFGGSDFIWFGIILSTVKIVSIPLLYQFMIIPQISSWGCSQNAARKLLVDLDMESPQGKQLAKGVHAMAVAHGWNRILEEFFESLQDWVSQGNLEAVQRYIKQAHMPKVCVVEVLQGTILAGDDAGSCAGFNVRSQNKDWESKMPRAIAVLQISPQADDRVAVFGDTDGNIRAIHVDTGDFVWEGRMPGKIAVLQISSDGKVAVAGDNGNIKAMNMETGNPLWEAKMPRTIAVLQISSDGKVAVAGDTDGNIKAINVDTGNPLWEAKMPRTITVLQIGSHAKVVVAGDTAGNLKAFTMETAGDTAGNFKDFPEFTMERDRLQVWEAKMPDTIAVLQISSDDKMAVAGDTAGNITAIHVDTGDRRWKDKMPSMISKFKLRRSDGNLVCVCINGTEKIFAVDTGELM